jgi:hypothetical protein
LVYDDFNNGQFENCLVISIIFSVEPFSASCTVGSAKSGSIITQNQQQQEDEEPVWLGLVGICRGSVTVVLTGNGAVPLEEECM